MVSKNKKKFIEGFVYRQKEIFAGILKGKDFFLSQILLHNKVATYNKLWGSIRTFLLE